MQKVIRRTVLAEKQAARRALKRTEKKQRALRKSTLEQYGFHRRDEIAQVKAARLAQREDWALGPLRPKRDVGEDKEAYGTIHTMRTKGPELTPRMKDQQHAFVGGENFPTIVIGDRVAITEGRDKGKIGPVVEMDFDRGEAKVQGLNLIDIKVPEWMYAGEQEQDKRAIRTMEKPVPFSSIRLIAQLQNAETGQVQDVVCEKVERTSPHFTKIPGSYASKVVYKRFIRMANGSRINIKFPDQYWQSKKTKRDALKDTASDTLRLEVEQKTFVPSLLRPPMPSSVIDELRNKYSIFRTRHDPDYIAKKQAEDAEQEEKKKLMAQMRTPTKEINRLEKKMKKAKGKGKLTEEMLEKIGKVIAEKRDMRLAMGGVLKEQPVAVMA